MDVREEDLLPIVTEQTDQGVRIPKRQIVSGGIPGNIQDSLMKRFDGKVLFRGNGMCPTCYDDVSNGDEYGVDCGGTGYVFEPPKSCEPCTCVDQTLQDNEEPLSDFLELQEVCVA